MCACGICILDALHNHLFFHLHCAFEAGPGILDARHNHIITVGDVKRHRALHQKYLLSMDAQLHSPQIFVIVVVIVVVVVTVIQVLLERATI